MLYICVKFHENWTDVITRPLAEKTLIDQCNNDVNSTYGMQPRQLRLTALTQQVVAGPSRARKSFPCPVTFGGPAIAQKYCKRCSRWLLTSIMHKVHFWMGLRPGSCWGAYDAPQISSWMVRRHLLHVSSLSMIGAYGM